MIGLCVLVSITEMQIMVYACETYEIALKQAEELLKGVNSKIERKEYQASNNGMRVTSFVLPELLEMIYVQESEIGKEVLLVE